MLYCYICWTSLFFSISLAQKKVEYSGYAEVGGLYEYKAYDPESYARAKLEFQFKLSSRTNVEIDIRGDSRKEQIELRQVVAEMEYSPQFEINVGKMRKRYGAEQQVSHEKLPTVERSLLHRFVAPFGYVSRDIGVQLHWKDKKETDRTDLWLGVHYNESRQLTLLARWSKHGILGLDQIGWDVLIERFRGEETFTVFAASVDAVYSSNSFSSDVEFFLGQDPIESQYRMLSGKSERAYFTAAKTTLTQKFQFDNELVKALEPVLLLTFLAPDVDNIDVNRVQLLLGFNIYLEKDVRLMMNSDVVLSNNRFNTKDRTLAGSVLTMQLQFQW